MALDNLPWDFKPDKKDSVNGNIASFILLWMERHYKNKGKKYATKQKRIKA